MVASTSSSHALGPEGVTQSVALALATHRGPPLALCVGQPSQSPHLLV